jgi:hemin uptake protein HemP
MADHAVNMPPNRRNDAQIHRPPGERRPQPRVDSGRLLAGSRELVIDHAGQEYRLRLTRNDKLILSK